MSVITLRGGEERDAEAVFAMLRALAHDVGEAEAFVSTLEDVRRDGLGPEARYEVLIAELDGAPAGLLSFFATYSTYKGRPCLYVNDLYVAPQARSRGVARRLMARVCRLAVTRGCCRVELKVLGNNRAQSFYEKIGMAATREVPHTLRGQAMAPLADEDG